MSGEQAPTGEAFFLIKMWRVPGLTSFEADSTKVWLYIKTTCK